MKYAHGLGALFLVLGGAAEAQAQFGFGGGFGGVGYSRPGLVVGYQTTRVGVATGVAGPGYFGYYSRSTTNYYNPVPFGGITNISIYSPPPVYVPQPIVIQPQVVQPLVIPQPIAVPVQQQPNLVDPIIIRPRDDAPLPGAVAGGFRPVRPEDRARAMQPVPPAKMMEDKKPPEKKKDPEAPKADLLDQGRAAFTDQEYGRALRFFKQATEAKPKDALGYFLQAQAQFALGKYREAVVSIHDGLRLDAEWPRGKFKAIALYGPNAADFTDQMDQLQAALKRNPTDAALLFLYAYELWFDAREDEARGLFLRARKLVVEPRFIDLFLTKPGADPVARR